MSTYPITTYDPKLMLDLRAWTGVDSLLMDGRIVQVRFRTDREALTALSTRVPPRSRYLRFLGWHLDR